MSLDMKNIVLYAVGDVGPNRDNPNTIFKNVKQIIQQGDIGFCQSNQSERRSDIIPPFLSVINIV